MGFGECWIRNNLQENQLTNFHDMPMVKGSSIHGNTDDIKRPHKFGMCFGKFLNRSPTFRLETQGRLWQSFEHDSAWISAKTAYCSIVINNNRRVKNGRFLLIHRVNTGRDHRHWIGLWTNQKIQHSSNTCWALDFSFPFHWKKEFSQWQVLEINPKRHHIDEFLIFDDFRISRPNLTTPHQKPGSVGLHLSFWAKSWHVSQGVNTFKDGP